MSDLHARAAEKLRDAHYRILGSSTDDAGVDPGEVLINALLSLPGVDVVELPEGAYVSVRWDRDALIAMANAGEVAEVTTQDVP